MILSDTLYNNLKWIAQIALPALGTLYFAIAGIWGLPFAQQIVGTIMAIDAFLGIGLGISSNAYKNAVAVFDQTVTKPVLPPDPTSTTPK